MRSLEPNLPESVCHNERETFVTAMHRILCQAANTPASMLGFLRSFAPKAGFQNSF